MKATKILLCCTFLFSFLLLNLYGEQTSTSQKTPSNYKDFLNAVKGMKVDSKMVIDVKNFTLKRDIGTYTFEEGTFYIVQPLFGRTCAAVFTGKGKFTYNPPIKVEKDQLERYLKIKEINNAFKSMFVFFTDKTLEDLKKHSQPREASETGKGNEVIATALKYIIKTPYDEVEHIIGRAFLDGRENNFFFSMMDMEGFFFPIFYAFDPLDEEEVKLMRGNWVSYLGNYEETINQFHDTKGYSTPGLDLTNENKAVLSIDNYKINFVITNNMNVGVETTMDITLKDKNVDWVPFSFSEGINVVGVVTDKEIPVEFYKEYKSDNLWLKLPADMKESQKGKIKLTYNSNQFLKNSTYDDIFHKSSSFIEMLSSTGWYPHYDYRRKSNFDVTFYYPDNFKLVSVGENVSNSKNEDKLISRWKAEKIRNFSFNLGHFDESTVKENDLPLIHILDINSRMTSNVKDDIKYSLLFYQNIYGPIKMNNFWVTEIPFGHGEAFPGLLHLSSSTFEYSDNKGFNEQFRSHEVAHQWWGIGVDFKTYRDQWLSEAFANYSSLLYTQIRLKDNDKFFDFLRDFRKKLLETRKSFISNGIEPGPISLGYRNNSTKTAGDYDLVIYEKGAWVLHMLRNMMLDLKTMKDDNFLKLLSDFYKTYEGKEASTKDFQTMVEKYTKQKMDWFFDEWVDGTKIPKYTFSYKTQEVPGGKFKVTVKVKQENVPQEFKMFMPVLIKFGKDQFTRLRIPVSGTNPQVDLPLLPLKPEEIIFNDMESVLCEMDTEKWKD